MSDVDTVSLKESKLYTLARSTPLLDKFTPNVQIQVTTESELEEVYPREEDDKEDTRIFVNYTNTKGNSSVFKIMNRSRLNTPIDIDDFIIKHSEASDDNEDPVDKITKTIMMMLSFSTNIMIGLEHGNKLEKILADKVLCALTSVVFDDPLDVVIGIREITTEGSDSIPTIIAVWATRSRHTVH